MTQLLRSVLVPRLAAVALVLAGPALAAQVDAQEPPAPPKQPETQPETHRGLQSASARADQGVTLFTPLQSKLTYLVDAAGETLHIWPSDYTPGNSVYLLEDGSVLRCAKDAGDSPYRGGGEGGRIQRIGWDGELLWDFAMASEDWRQHHDIAPMPNGHVLAIVWEGVSQKAAVRSGRDRDAVGEAGLWPDAIIELAPRGLNEADIVWEWHAWDHLVQDRHAEQKNFVESIQVPGRIDVNYDVLERPKTEEELAKEDAVADHLRSLGYAGGDGDDEKDGQREPGSDWMHTNSIDYEPVNDLVAISVREASEVWIIDHSTTTEEARTGKGGRRGHGGELLYRFGHPATYGGTAPRQLFHQHDARFVAVGEELHMSVFNNGGGRPGGDRSSVDEYRLPFTAESGFEVDSTGMPKQPELVWSYDGGETVLYNGHISGAQRLAGGSMLMCLGEEGRTIEVSREGEILWDWLQPIASEGGGPGGDRGGRRGPPSGGPPRDGRGPEGRGPDGRGPRPGGGPPGPGRPWPDRPGAGPPGGLGPGGAGPPGKFGLFRVTRYPADYVSATASAPR